MYRIGLGIQAIPNITLDEKVSPSQAIKTLETNLRKSIQEHLSEIDDNWWKSKKPPDVRDNAERRKEAND